MKGNKLKKVLQVLLTFILIATNIGSNSNKVYAEEETNLGSKIFYDVEVIANGSTLESGSVTEVDITDDLKLDVTLKWRLDDDIYLKAGDWAELQLPTLLSSVASPTSGPLLVGGKTVGTYEITSGGKLKVIFNNELINEVERSGKIEELFYFDLTKFEDDANQIIEFKDSINKNFTFVLKPTVESNYEINDEPIPLASETDLGSGIFKDVKVEVNGSELVDGSVTDVSITDGLQLQITFNWELEDNVDLNSGDWAELQLPGSLSGVSSSTSGSLLDNDSNIIGSYEITSEGKLKVVFNDELVGKIDRKGEVGLLLKFDVSEFEDDVYQKLEFGEPINKGFGIKVKPTGKVFDIDKIGEADAKINPTYIDWTVDVNTKLEALTNGSVEDVIPNGLILDPSSVEIYELIVGSEGKLTQGGSVTKTVSTDGGKLKVDFGETDKAYRIKYKTTIEGELEGTYTNTATLKDNETDKATASATVDGLSKGSQIEKEGWQNSENKDEIIWRIYVNKAEEALNNVKVLDTLPAGLTLDSIHYWKSDASGNYGAYVGKATEFPLVLGDITGAYLIQVISKIDYNYFDNYTNQLSFENKAELEVDGIVKDSAKDEVTIDRGSLLEKSGKETTSYGDSIISWTLNVNKAKQSINNATITDTIGAGLELIEGSLSVYNETTKTTLSASDYTFTKNTDGTFTIKLGDITDEFTIKYDTKIIASLGEGQTGYSNKGELSGDSGLSGDGVGPEDTSKEVIVKPSVSNIYSKDNEYYKVVDGITYDGINYASKTMSWKLTVDAVKEKITELKITDYFEPATTMKFIEDTLKVVVGETVLVKDTDYTLVDKGVNGFELVFINDHKPLKRAKYEVYFKTSFDPNEVLAAGGVLNTKENGQYTNHVTYTGKVEDLEGKIRDLEESSEANYWTGTEYANNGKKSGSLDRDNRTISWQIYTNASGHDLTGGEFIITDELTAGNQTVNNDVVVYEYSLEKDGNQTKGNLINVSEYELVYDDDGKGFTVTFSNGVNVPVLVEFTSKINGLSEEWYKNQAVVSDKTEQNKTYDAQVKYDDYNKFIDKKALNDDKGNVYTDDELKWEVTLNHSLSKIPNAVFKDDISKGLVLLNDSIKVYKGSINDGNLVTLATDAVSITTNSSGETELTITLGDLEEVKFFVTYATVVV
ncbi:MAG: hypothetical protein GX675_03635 [Erysipelotrichaceae bacterium]|nr:hypothetical protein [Erysipelotrichaceae bacterium]